MAVYTEIGRSSVRQAKNNFTAVVKQAGQGRRAHYLHLYLPLVENNVDKICKYSNDNRYKLEDAIRQMRVVEAREEQKTDIDNLYGTLFPKHFLHAMSSSRPAATIADLKEEVVAKDQRIKELEDAVDDVTNKYNNVLEQLKNAVKDVESDKFSPEDLMAAFLRFPTELAISFYGSMSTLIGSGGVQLLLYGDDLKKLPKSFQNGGVILENLAVVCKKPVDLDLHIGRLRVDRTGESRLCEIAELRHEG